MSQQHLSHFVSPLTQPLDDVHTHLSHLSVAYSTFNTSLRTHTNSLLTGTQGFQGNGANTFSSLVDYCAGAMEKHCNALDNGASAARSCNTQVNNAVDNASSKHLDTTIVAHVLNQVMLDDIIRQGGDAINPIMRDLQNTCNQMQSTWNDLQKTLAHENKLMNDANNAADQEWKDLSSFNFGGLGSDIGRYWGDQWQKLSYWGQEAGDYVQLGSEGLHIAWDAIQLTWQALVQWAEDIFQAVKNCLSTIGSIVTTTTRDINAFMGKLGPIVQEILKDSRTAFLDEEKGNDLGALAALADMLVNPELMLNGMQPLSQGQMEEIIVKKAPWLLEMFKKLPLWTKIAIVVLVLAGLGFFIFRDKLGNGSSSQGQAIYVGGQFNKKDLIDELKKNNANFSEENIVGITRTPDGRVVWLEEGNKKAGLEHILYGEQTPEDQGHINDFANIGVIGRENIIKLIMDTVTNERPTGKSGGRPYYKVVINGTERTIVVIIGSNGFIVTAYPITVKRKGTAK